MRFAEIRILKSVLGREIGWSWIPTLMRTSIRKRSVFRNTHWIYEEGPETKFVKRLSLPSALFLGLQEGFGKERAFDIMRRIIIPIGYNQQWEHLKSLRLSDKEPMKRLMAFNDLMDMKGAPRFNRRKYVERNDDICHFVITKCVFKDFFNEAATPELTRLFCDVDREFFPKAFPDLEFHRGGSWENTIAHGKDHCEFIFERRK